MGKRRENDQSEERRVTIDTSYGGIDPIYEYLCDGRSDRYYGY